MKMHIQYEGTGNLEELFGEFTNTITNEEYKTTLRKLYDQWKYLGEGSDAPAFSYPNIEGDTVNLEGFKGKYIYVDVWATWCGPCIRELPFLEKLQEEYAGKNIVFISISIDKDQNSWEQMVAEKEMKGVQLIANKGWKAAICDAYAINSIPRFLLIDREGKIISARAERPSGKIGEVLGSLEDISG
jgi:thiol-disulfide isomerase/thioredoxin